MNPTYIKRIVIALAVVLLAYFLFFKEAPAPKIITTYNNLPDNTKTTTTQTPSVQSPAQATEDTPKVTEPAAPVAIPENSAATSTITNKINLADLKVQYLNPEAPCPAKQMSCYALPGGMTIDASCPTYKPVWAYVSLDKGLSWIQVGCFATEIDAEKAISKAQQTGVVKPIQNGVVVGKIKSAEPTSAVIDSADEPQIQAPNNNLGTILPSPEIKTIDTKPIEPKPLEAKPAEAKTEEKHSVIELVNTKPAQPSTEVKVVKEAKEEQAPAAQKTEPAKVAKSEKTKVSEDLTVNFRTAFGLVSVEKRTYPNAEMKHKAIKMWDNGQRLLEPDGSINDKYMVKPKDSNAIPGPQN
jgi:hypothetical protein